MWYVQIIGPYDCTFVGPFAGKADADMWTGNKPGNFDYIVLSEAQVNANMMEFGVSPIENPNDVQLKSCEYAFHRGAP